jgi:hypothetical protein
VTTVPSASGFLMGFHQKMASFGEEASSAPSAQQFNDLIMQLHRLQLPVSVKSPVMAQLEQQQLPQMQGSSLMSGLFGAAGALLTQMAISRFNLPLAARVPLWGLGFGGGSLLGENLSKPTITSTKKDLSEKF